MMVNPRHSQGQLAVSKDSRLVNDRRALPILCSFRISARLVLGVFNFRVNRSSLGSDEMIFPIAEGCSMRRPFGIVKASIHGNRDKETASSKLR